MRISEYGGNSAFGTYTFALFKGGYKDSVKEQPGSASVVMCITGELRENCTIIIEAHNRQQAVRISDCAGFLQESTAMGFDETKTIFPTLRKRKLKTTSSVVWVDFPSLRDSMCYS